MKNIIFTFLFLSTSLVACSKKKIEKATPSKLEKETTTVKKENIPEAKTPSTKATSKANISEDIDVNLVAKIKRTPCFGKCPVFTVELYNNGIVKYNGIAFVERKGSFIAKVKPEFIKQIQDKALSIKYLSFENKYPIAPIAIADLPTTTTYIRIGNVGKQVTDNYDAPRELIEFERWLENEFDELEWQPEGGK